MKVLKYIYYKTIQENWGYGDGWEDVDFHVSDSTGWIKDKTARDLFKDNLKAYRENSSASVKVGRFKEINPKWKEVNA